MSDNKRQPRVHGDIVRIDLGDGFHSYARVLEEGLFAFYNCRTQEDLPIQQIIAMDVLFIIPVMSHAVTRGRWTVKGNAPLEDCLLNPPPRFIQDAIRKEKFSLYQKGRIIPATRQQCLGLEREAGWEPEHAEDRLRDHYAGRTNKWVESLRLRD